MARCRVAVATAALVAVACAGCGGGFGSFASPSAGPSTGPSVRLSVPAPSTSTVGKRRSRRVPKVDRVGLVRAAHWQVTSEGDRLIVRASGAGRRLAAAAPSRALSQALHHARPTPARLSSSQRASLLNQLRCHASFAAYKPTWDLEAWRPNVGYSNTVLALCNP